MTDDESPTESQPTESQPTESEGVEQSAEQPTEQVASETESLPTQAQPTEQVTAYATDPDDEAPTEMIGGAPTGRRPLDPTMKRVLIVSGAIVLVAALAFTLTQVIRKDGSPAVDETAAAEVFLEPADSAGDSPFAPTSFTTKQPDPLNPGSDPLGPPPAEPAPPPDGQAAPMVLRTANGDLPGLYGGTLDTTTCDAELMINYLGQNPNQGRAWASVHRINPDQIRAYVTGLTPVLLRTDTRVTDHGYIDVAQAIPRQAVLQAGTAVLIDNYGSPRARCISGSPLLDPVAATAPAARPAGNVAVQPAAAPARPRVIFVGPRWPRFDPVTIVVIRRFIRPIDFFFLWDFRRGVFFARRIGILIRDIANLLDPVLRGLVPAILLARAPARLPAAPLPVQAAPPVRLPVQQAPPPRQAAPPQAVPPRQGAPAPAAPAPVPAGVPPMAPPPAQPPPVILAEPPLAPAPDLPIFFPQDPVIPLAPASPPMAGSGTHSGPALAPASPPMAGSGTHSGPALAPASPPMAGSGTHSGPALAPASPPMAGSGGSQQPGLVPQGEGTHVPAISGSNTNPAYPDLPQAPSSGGHQAGPIPAEEDTGGYTPPDYGSLPGSSDSGGDPGGSLQCDPLLNPC